jgi:hypothetical protein
MERRNLRSGPVSQTAAIESKEVEVVGYECDGIIPRGRRDGLSLKGFSPGALLNESLASDHRALPAGNAACTLPTSSVLSFATIHLPATTSPTRLPLLTRGSYREPASHVVGASRSFSVWFSSCGAIPGELRASLPGRDRMSESGAHRFLILCWSTLARLRNYRRRSKSSLA